MSYSIKMSPEDFRVEEIPKDIPRKADGKYFVARIRLNNWETNHFVSTLARQLSISRKRVTYCGTKDKRAITDQYFCINIQDNPDIRIKDVEVLESFRSDKMLSLGDLMGNKFTIKVDSNIPEEILQERIHKSIEKGGFLNYFGIQRFGSARSNTDIVGKKLVKDGIEAAVKEYLYDSDIDTEEYRVNLGNSWDFAAGFREFPEHLQFERAMLNSLVHEENYNLAFEALPGNLRMMFIHAFQSRMFNRILDLRKSLLEEPFNAIPGDFASPVDNFSNIDESHIIPVDSFNQVHINDLIKNRKLTVVAPLIGYATPKVDGIPGEIVETALNEENVTREEFNMDGNRELSSSGTYRAVSFLPRELSLENGWIKFGLGRGTYATVLIDQVYSD
jgi:tRNA pseudouridine13 synthase